MNRSAIAAAVFALAVAVTAAQDPPQPPANPVPAKGIQAKAIQIQPVPGQPAVPPLTKAAANRIAAAEEEVETLEAHRDVRKAHVRAAEVAVKAAEVTFERMAQAAKSGPVSVMELDRAKIEVEAAKAQLEIRIAETKEVEVKIKYAKKRLDDAKAAVRPAAGVRPVDPPPPQ